MSQLYSITLRGEEILELLFTAHPNVYFAGAHFKAWKEILRKTVTIFLRKSLLTQYQSTYLSSSSSPWNWCDIFYSSVDISINKIVLKT